MSFMDSMRRYMAPEKLTATLMTKVTPTDDKRVNVLVKKLGLTRSSFTRIAVMDAVEKLEQELGIDP
jgi:hypothetical protein